MIRYVLAALAIATLIAAAVPGVAAAAGYRKCSGTMGPRGEPGQGFWREIRVKRTSCKAGKRLIRTYLRTTGGGRARVRGYRCNIRIVTTREDQNGTGHLRCVRGRRAVRATGHP